MWIIGFIVGVFDCLIFISFCFSLLLFPIYCSLFCCVFLRVLSFSISLTSHGANKFLLWFLFYFFFPFFFRAKTEALVTFMSKNYWWIFLFWVHSDCSRFAGGALLFINLVFNCASWFGYQLYSVFPFSRRDLLWVRWYSIGS